MPTHALHHVNLLASAPLVHALRDFYCDVVGLVEGERPPFKSSGFWLYAAGVPVLHLSSTSEGEGRPANGSVLNHIAFRCTDLEGTLVRLRSHNVVFSSAEVPLVGETQIQFKDPAGIGVELSFARMRA